MRAILLAAGLGTRLRPLTNTVPKCLVPVRGRPLLGIWLERLVSSGVGPLLVNTHYLAEQVNHFLNASPYIDLVTLVHEPEMKGTAGTFIANLDFFAEEDGMLIHADNYCLSDLTAFQQAHINRPIGCLMTMMTFRTNDPTSCGIIELDDQSIAIRFHEKVGNPPGNLANGAVYILSREFMKIVKHSFSDATDFSNDILPNFLGKIYTFETSNFFMDIGTPESYNKANQLD